MGNILKIEAFSGASGDMFLSALAGLSGNYEELLGLPALLNFEDEAEINITDVQKNGISCKQVKVLELKEQKNHRHLKEITKIIEDSGLTEGAKSIANEIFKIIGEAEAEVHNIPFEKIHFHEIGAVDSILDICGAAHFLDKLNISKSFLSSIVTGKGFVKTAHGLLPVPAPATKLILEGLPYQFGNEDGEKLTPTGAAIIKYLDPVIGDPLLIDEKSAYGAGEKDFSAPNVLLLSICKSVNDKDEMILIETNIDDGNSEYLGLEFQNKLFELSALDFYFTQIIMKKGRPGLLLTVVCKKSALKQISEFILHFTSTIGVRYYPTERIELDREIKYVDTEFGKFRIKVSKSQDGTEKIKPESEDILNYSINNGVMPNIVSQKIIESYNTQK